MNEDIKKLIELQKIDLVIQKLEVKKAEIPQQIQECESTASEANTSLENSQKIYKEKQVEHKNYEIELASIEEQIKKHQGELNIIKTNEAYKALLKEITDENVKKEELEETILKKLEEIDLVNEEIKKFTEKSGQFDAECKEKVGKFQGELQVLENEISTRATERKSIVDTVSEKIVAAYEKIKTYKKGRGIAEVKGSVCGGCSLEIAPQILNQVLEGKEIITCANCGRILYIADENLENVRNS